MTTTVLKRSGLVTTGVYNSHVQFEQPRTTKLVQYKKTDGSTGRKLVHTGVPVFRSGTFRDSWGDEMTYETIHMDQMKANFDFLAAKNILTDPPVRKGHPSFLGNDMEDLIGYLTGAVTQDMKSPVDGLMYRYFLADYEIIDDQAIDNINSGLWRHRSAEIGRFGTNDNSEFWPVFMGFAFVSIPAVEGLHINGFSKTGQPIEFTMSKPTKEYDVAGKEETPPAHAPAPAGTPAKATTTTTAVAAQPDPPAPDASATEQPQVAGQVQKVDTTVTGDDLPATGAPVGAEGSFIVPDLFVSGVDDDDDPDGAKSGNKPIEQNQTLEPGAPGPEQNVVKTIQEPDLGDRNLPDVSQITEKPQGPVGVFMIGGIKTNNFQQVQTYITNLEKMLHAGQDAERTAFCNQLTKDGRILASQLDDFVAFALKLPADQYAAWSALQVAAPSQRLFSGHLNAVADQTAGSPAEADSAKQKEYTTAYDIVENMALGNLNRAQLESTPSYKKMVSLAKDLGITDNKFIKE